MKPGKRTRKEVLNFEFLEYYKTIKTKPSLFIEVKTINDDFYLLNMTNFIVMFIFERYNMVDWFQLYCVMLPKMSSLPSSAVDPEPVFQHRRSIYSKAISVSLVGTEAGMNSLPSDVYCCQRPSVLIEERKLVISGLTSVLRFLLKLSSFKCAELNLHEERRKEMEQLLGFRGGCLSACAEASTWTMFCEFEMTQRMVSALISTLKNCKATGIIEIPEDLVRFEYHLTQPVRIHNFRKIIQDKQSVSGSCKPNRSEWEPEHIYQLAHDYAEGPDMTLSDMILFPCVQLSMQTLGIDVLSVHLPKVTNWHHRQQSKLQESSFQVEFANSPQEIISIDLMAHANQVTDTAILKIPHVPCESLYKSDPPRDKWKTSEYTKQADVEEAFDILQTKRIHLLEASVDTMNGMEEFMDWTNVPLLVHPEGGHLPEYRRARKSHQLASLVQIVKYVYHQKRCVSVQSMSNITIVDFCSGGGHLGILVAWIIPEAKVILVENKGESLRRAQDRIDKLGLSNIKLFQCNLTSFIGKFDIGMALHACGSATDLVLKKCEDNRAAFVVSPCCYGAIQSTHTLIYPRSCRFKESQLSLRQYFVFAHSSDQTHDEKNAKTSQGQACMRVVDTDRLVYFQEQNYRVWLRKMTPETASPKNHILVGIP